jgi:hypothetical protein
MHVTRPDFVLDSYCARMENAHLPVPGYKAQLVLERLPGCLDLFQVMHRLFEIVGVDHAVGFYGQRAGERPEIASQRATPRTIERRLAAWALVKPKNERGLMRMNSTRKRATPVSTR